MTINWIGWAFLLICSGTAFLVGRAYEERIGLAKLIAQSKEFDKRIAKMFADLEELRLKIRGATDD